MKEIKFNEIEGIKVGHDQNLQAATGCTVIICEKGAFTGVDVRGGAPGTRETDLLDPVNLVQQVHAVLLGGGSAFGLDAASGIMQYLEENDVGFDVGVTKVPIVSGAVLFDLTIGDHRIRPDKEMGYRACKNAGNFDCPNGSIGAGTGATVGKFLGGEFSMKGGLGTYAVQVGDLQVGALVAVNCLGDVIDPKTGEILAGALTNDKRSFVDTEKAMIEQLNHQKNLFSGNTTIGVVVTNAKLDKAKACKIASMAHNGYARTMRPAHTMVDGDTIFTMGSGEVQADTNVIGMLSTTVMAEAVVRAIKSATSLHGYMSYGELRSGSGTRK